MLILESYSISEHPVLLHVLVSTFHINVIRNKYVENGSCGKRF